MLSNIANSQLLEGKTNKKCNCFTQTYDGTNIDRDSLYTN